MSSNKNLIKQQQKEPSGSSLYCRSAPCTPCQALECVGVAFQDGGLNAIEPNLSDLFLQKGDLKTLIVAVTDVVVKHSEIIEKQKK